jgi:hypothetical protein
MIIKAMGIIDILAGFWMLLAQFDIVGWATSSVFVIYLLVKIFIFRDLISFFDMLSGLYFIVVLLGAHWALTYLFVAYLIQKGITSMF